MGKKDTEKLVSRVKELSSDGEYIRLFDKEENYKELIRNTELAEAREDGVKEGIEQGSREAKVDIAKNLIKAGLDNNKISEFTGLPIKEVENLRKS